MNFDHALTTVEYVAGIVCQFVKEANPVTVHFFSPKSDDLAYKGVNKERFLT